MATSIDIELLGDGIRELFQEPGIVAEVDKAAQKIAAEANAIYGGSGYVVKPAEVIGDRPTALVVADSWKAKYGEAVYKNLSRAVARYDAASGTN